MGGHNSVPLPHVDFHFNSSTYIPDTFVDGCFDEFGERIDVSTSTEASHISIRFNDDHADADFQQAVLIAFARSTFFRIHAKQIKFLEMEKLLLNDWMPFVKSFAQHEPKLEELSLSDCHFTQDGARTLGWMLDNQQSGIQIETLILLQPTGDSSWISGLSNNTTIKNLSTTNLSCGLEFLDFLRQQSSLNQFEKIYCDGLQNRFFSSRKKEKFYLTIELGCEHEGEYSNSDDDPENCLKMRFQITDCGNVSLVVQGHDEWQGNLDLHWNTFWNLLNFRKEQQKAFKVRFSNFVLESCESFPQTIAACNYASLQELRLSRCKISKQASVQLGWLLDTDASGFDIETLAISELVGNTAWVVGFYKNKSISSLELSNFGFWHSGLHFLLNGKPNKLKFVRFSNLEEEENGRPYYVDNHMLGNTVDTTNHNTNSEARGNLDSLQIFLFGRLRFDREHNYYRFPKSVCESIGTVLRRATSLHSLMINDAGIHPEYNFLQDAMACQEIHLDNTDFEPHLLASLINNGHLKSKRLCLDKYSQNGIASAEKIVELLKLADITLLDQLDIGETMAPIIFPVLCQQLAQNKAPRRLHWFFHPDFDHEPERHNKDHIKKMGTSLAGNSKIEELQLSFDFSLFAREMLQFFRLICQMPSLKEFRVLGLDLLVEVDSDCECELCDNEECLHLSVVGERVQRDVKECQHFIIRQNLERNIHWYSERILDQTIRSMLKRYWQCKQLLGCTTNELPDGIWAHVFAKGYERRDWEFEDEDTKEQTADVLFYLVRQLPGLFQQAGDQDDSKDEGPRFTVPHHPNCPGCHKRQKVLLSPR